MVLQNPFPPQGLVTKQLTVPQSSQPSTYSPTGYPSFHNVFIKSVEVNLQTQCHQYGTPSNLVTRDNAKDLPLIYKPFHMLCPMVNPNRKVPKFPLHCTTHHPNVRATHN